MKPKKNYITPQQFKDMIDYIPELHIRKWKDRDVEYAFKIAYYCCLRLGEVPALTKEHFDLDRKEVYLGHTKTRKEDYAPISELFIDELRDYLDTKDPHEQILPHEKLDNITQNLYKWLLKMGEALDIEALNTPQSVTGEKTKLHIFRKSMLKDIVYGTFGIKGHIGQAQSMARHKRATTTADYLHLDIEGSKEFWEIVTQHNISNEEIQELKNDIN